MKVAFAGVVRAPRATALRPELKSDLQVATNQTPSQLPVRHLMRGRRRGERHCANVGRRVTNFVNETAHNPSLHSFTKLQTVKELFGFSQSQVKQSLAYDVAITETHWHTQSANKFIQRQSLNLPNKPPGRNWK